MGLTKTIAIENAKTGIRINCVSPGFIGTPMVTGEKPDESPLVKAVSALTPMGRLGTPEEIAKVVAFLSSEHASYITGTTIFADGGWLAGKG